MNVSTIIFALERVVERLKEMGDPHTALEVRAAVLKLREYQRQTTKLLSLSIDIAASSGVEDLLYGRLINDGALDDLQQATDELYSEFFEEYYPEGVGK